MEIAKNGLREY